MATNKLPSLAKLRDLASRHHSPISGWPQVVLILAGLYNITFGLWAILFPSHYFTLNALVPANQNLWQCIGMIVGLYGLGYLIASSDIYRYWPLVLIGFLGKIFGPLGYLYGLILGETKLAGLIIIFFNDLIWLVPFGIILLKVVNTSWRRNHAVEKEIEPEILDAYKNIHKQVKNNQKILIIFLRHTGCTFCREALLTFYKEYKEIRELGITPILVHMGSNDSFQEWLDNNGLSEVTHIRDKSLLLYSLFELKRATVFDAFSPVIFVKALKALRQNNLGVGTLDGDGYQLAGCFLLEGANIKASIRNQDVSNGYSYLDLIASSKAPQAPIEGPELTLYYDEDCPLCRKEVNLLKSLTPEGTVEYVDISSEDFETAKHGKSCDLLMKEIHAKDNEGNWIVGMEVFRRLYSYTPYSWVFKLSSLPVIREIADYAYLTFAKNRLWLTGRVGKLN